MATVFNGNVGVTDNAPESTKLPAGTTAQRPTTPEEGMIRFNAEENTFEFYDGTEWLSL